MSLIEEQPVPPEKVILAGFSQGGAIVLQTALRYPKKLAGVMALSTYLPLAATLAAEKSAANATPRAVSSAIAASMMRGACA